MVTLLQAKKYASAEQLAEHFGISVRTVYRDIKALSEQGVPVSFEPQRDYCLVPGYLLPPVSFTQQEAQAPLLLHTVAAALADASIEAAYSMAFQKVQAVLRGPAKEQLSRLAGHCKMQLPESVRGGAFSTLRTGRSPITSAFSSYLMRYNF